MECNGGREVGLANMLAAHMDLDNPASTIGTAVLAQPKRLQKQVGLKAVDLLKRLKAEKLKPFGLWRPILVSLPNADQVKRAPEKCEFVVVSTYCLDTDTTNMPMCYCLHWVGGKRRHSHHSERRISDSVLFRHSRTSTSGLVVSFTSCEKIGISGF